MIDFTTINNTLTQLDGAYSSTTDANMLQLYSKLAILELSGWIEVSFDTLCQDYVNRKIVFTANQVKIMQIVKKHYGYSYESNIYPMMCSVLGINNWENILYSFPTADLINLKSILGTYKTLRDPAAHTNTVVGVTPTFRAPSTVIVDFNQIKPSFQYLETSIYAL